jgi:transcription initiation factor TFIIB
MLEEDQLDNHLNKKCIYNDDCTNGPIITDNARGEILCGHCGRVLAEKCGDSGHGKQGPEENVEHRGGPTSLRLYDRGLITIIDSSNKDATGHLLKNYQKLTFRRLRVWNCRNNTRGVKRSLVKAFILLDTLKAKLAIPDSVAEETAYIFRKAVNKKLTRGRNTSALICASLYAACRGAGIPRSLNDIVEAANVNRTLLTRNYRLLIQSLDLKIQPYSSSEFITKISSEVGISEKTRRGALDLLSKIEEKELDAGKNPVGLAAAALHLSCLINGELKSQGDIARASGITAVTIRNRITSIKKSFDIITA